MRVLHVTTGGRIGGAERLLFDVLGAGRERSLWDASVCILGPGDELAARLGAAGVPVFALGARGAAGLAGALPRLARLILARRYDVVHGHLLHGAAVAMLAARAVGHRCAVMTRHYERFVWMYGSRGDRTLHRLGHGLARHVFAISAASRDVLVDVEGMDPSKVTVVLNGIDIARVRSLAPAAAAAAAAGAAVTLGSVGSLHVRKGHADLIRALATLRARDRARLVLIGDGPERAALAALAAALGVGERVQLAGYTPDPYARMRTFDVYVQPSREEGFGLAVLEAMALGLPVVVSGAGGLPEIIDDPACGVVVPAGDPTALARELDIVIADPARRTALGRGATQRVETAFDVRGTAEGYAASYRRLLGSSGSSAGAAAG